MILVVVGTHHQPFERLLTAAGQLAQAFPDELVVVQRGVSRSTPPGCEVVDHLSPDDLTRRFDEARVIVLHGGTSVFLEATSLGRVPIVVPRRAAFGEHVDDHQVEFTGSLQPDEAVVGEPDQLVALVRAHRERRRPPRDRGGAFAERLGRLVDGLVLARREGPPDRRRLRKRHRSLAGLRVS